jgi:HEAT repeat protein
MSLMEMGIAAVRSGNRTEARMLLEAATLQEPENAQALLWLSFVLDEPKLAMRCLERVLEIEPNNAQAQRGLTWLRSQQAGKGQALPQRLADAELSALTKALNRPDEHIVVKAVQCLGASGDSRAVDPLVNLLVTSKNPAILAQVRAALAAIGTPSVEPVMARLMKERNPQAASQLAAVLARVRSMAALAACREVIEGAETPVARYSMALNLTASAHGEAAVSLLHDYLLDSRQDERARAAVVTALGQAIKARAMEAVPGLKTLMETRANPSLPVSLRRTALVALGISSQASVVRCIFEASADHDVQMRLAAVDALARFTPPQVQLLDRLARSPDQAVRTRANQVLDALKAKR